MESYTKHRKKKTRVSIKNIDALFTAIEKAFENSDVVSLVKGSKDEVFIVPELPLNDEYEDDDGA
jgi:hypothetical protein